MQFKERVDDALEIISAPMEELFKKFSSKSGAEWFVQYLKFLEEKPTWMLSANAQKEALKFSGCCIIPASPGIFHIQKKIHIKSSIVKFAFIDNFVVNLLSQPEGPALLRPINYFLLQKHVTLSMLVNLGSVRLSSFQDMWYLLKKQPNGEDGPLLVDGKNIFFVERSSKTIPILLTHSPEGWRLNQLLRLDLGEKIFLR
jgi:hypothetical protein